MQHITYKISIKYENVAHQEKIFYGNKKHICHQAMHELGGTKPCKTGLRWTILDKETHMCETTYTCV